MNFYRILKHRWLIFLSLCFLTFLCAIEMPALAKLPASHLVTANTQIAKLNNTQKFQANGQYRQACQSLVEELEITDFNCRQLVNEEMSTNKIQRILNNLPVSPPQVSKLTNLGELLRLLGALESSEAVLTQTLELSQKLEDLELISQVYLSLGNTKRALGKREKLLNNIQNDNFKYSLEFYQKAGELSPSRFTQLRAKNSLLNLILEDELQDIDLSPLWQEIKLGINELPISPETLYLRFDFAQTLTFLNLKETKPDPTENFPSPLVLFSINHNHQSAFNNLVKPEFNDIVEFVAQSVQQAEILENPRLLSYALGNLGEFYEINQQWESARQLTENALNIAQSIQAKDITYRLQWQLGRLSYKLKGNNPEAIQAYNGAFETLQSLRKDLASINRDVQFSFRDEVEPVYRQFVEILLEPQQPIQENLQLARRVIEGLQLAELDDFFRDACAEAKPEQIDQVVDELDLTAGVIYPIILENKLAVILKLPKQKDLYYYSNSKSKQEVEKLLDDLLGELKQEHPSPEGKKLSKQVYSWLIQPAEEKLNKQQIKTLVFVLDGLLRNIPMAALHDGKEYLIKKYGIASAPGLQLLSPKPLNRDALKVLGAGVSIEQTVEGQYYAAIKKVEQELEEVKNNVSPSTIFLNESFTDVNLQTELNSTDFSVVHIATHGNFSSDPEQTFIVAWGKLIKVKDLDKLLRVNDRKKDNPIELLILTACDTAEGDQRATLGLAGVAVRAGARSTIASLWRANDSLSSSLVSEFYNQLQSNPDISKAEALRQAQLKIIEDDVDNLISPYQWAPYILLGNWQ